MSNQPEPGPRQQLAETTELGKTARVFAALHQSAEQDVSRVIALYEQWVQSGPPPLGTSISRWWDKRLAEMRAALVDGAPDNGTGQHPAIAAWGNAFDRANQAEAERDRAYRERAQLLALLAAMTHQPAIVPAADVEGPGWQILYLYIGGRQASWHIAPRDADLFTHVQDRDESSPLAWWDGHTTEEKYARIADHIAHRHFTPPAHCTSSDGKPTCVHAIPVGPDSCWTCRTLAGTDQPKES